MHTRESVFCLWGGGRGGGIWRALCWLCELVVHSSTCFLLHYDSAALCLLLTMSALSLGAALARDQKSIGGQGINQACTLIMWGAVPLKTHAGSRRELWPSPQRAPFAGKVICVTGSGCFLVYLLRWDVLLIVTSFRRLSFPMN